MSDKYSIKVRQPVVGAKNAGGGSSGGGLWADFPAEGLARRRAYYYFNDFDTVQPGATVASGTDLSVKEWGQTIVATASITLATSAGTNTVQTVGSTGDGRGGRVVFSNDGTATHSAQMNLLRGLLQPASGLVTYSPSGTGPSYTIPKSTMFFEVAMQNNTLTGLNSGFLGLTTTAANAAANWPMVTATGIPTTAAGFTGAAFYFPGDGSYTTKLQYYNNGTATTVTPSATFTPYWQRTDGGTALGPFDRYGIRITGLTRIEWFFNDRRVGQVSGISPLAGNGVLYGPSFGWTAMGSVGATETMVLDWVACGQTPRIITS